MLSTSECFLSSLVVLSLLVVGVVGFLSSLVVGVAGFLSSLVVGVLSFLVVVVGFRSSLGVLSFLVVVVVVVGFLSTLVVDFLSSRVVVGFLSSLGDGCFLSSFGFENLGLCGASSSLSRSLIDSIATCWSISSFGSDKTGGFIPHSIKKSIFCTNTSSVHPFTTCLDIPCDSKIGYH